MKYILALGQSATKTAREAAPKVASLARELQRVAQTFTLPGVMTPASEPRA